jgi:hypothetical protein
MNQYITEQTILFLQRNSQPRSQASDKAENTPRRGLYIRRLTTTGLRRFFAYALQNRQQTRSSAAQGSKMEKGSA